MDFRLATLSTGAQRLELLQQALASARWEYLLAEHFHSGWPEAVTLSNLHIDDTADPLRITLDVAFTQRSPMTCEGKDYCYAQQTSLLILINPATGTHTLEVVNRNYRARGEVY